MEPANDAGGFYKPRPEGGERSGRTAAFPLFSFDRSAKALDHIGVAEPVNAHAPANNAARVLMTEPA